MFKLFLSCCNRNIFIISVTFNDFYRNLCWTTKIVMSDTADNCSWSWAFFKFFDYYVDLKVTPVRLDRNVEIRRLQNSSSLVCPILRLQSKSRKMFNVKHTKGSRQKLLFSSLLLIVRFVSDKKCLFFFSLSLSFFPRFYSLRKRSRWGVLFRGFKDWKQRMIICGRSCLYWKSSEWDGFGFPGRNVRVGSRCYCSYQTAPTYPGVTEFPQPTLKKRLECLRKTHQKAGEEKKYATNL